MMKEKPADCPTNPEVIRYLIMMDGHMDLKTRVTCLYVHIRLIIFQNQVFNMS